MTARLLRPVQDRIRREVNATVHGGGGFHLERYDRPPGDPGLLGPDSVTWRVHGDPPGIMIERNPGVTLIWECLSYRATRQPEGGLLFHIGSPQRTSWWREGREATRHEIIDSIRTGLPHLQRVAEAEGPGAIQLLQTLVERAVRLVPAT